MQGHFKVILLLPIFAIFSGCQPRATKWEAGETFKTQIIVSKSFGTEFRQVELKGVMNKATLEGTVVDFYHSPSEENGNVTGMKPLARFIEDDGVYIPADQISLQMVTLYFHLQQIKEMELKALSSNESILKWPRKVALSVRVLNAPEMKFDNAFYNTNVDALYFVPYKDSAFPIPLNPGIIGHEMFHAYFSHLVLNPLTGKQKLSVSHTYKQYVLKIINEALADVWGWAYSGDPDFVAHSLPRVGHQRNLEKGADFSLPKVMSQQELKNEAAKIESHCKGKETKCITDLSYVRGVMLSRGFKQFASARAQSRSLSEQDSRSMIATALLKVSAGIEKSMDAGDTIDLDKVFLLLKNQFDSLNETECLALQNVMSGPGVIKCDSNTALLAQ